MVLDPTIYTSESDVSRRQIVTYKDGPRTERVSWSGVDFLILKYTCDASLLLKQ